jgi:hypothetical protein
MKGLSPLITAFALAGVSIGCSESMLPVGPSTTLGRNAGAPLAPLPSGHGGTATAKEVPFKGRLQGIVTLDLTGFPMVHVLIAASGEATHLGRFTLEMPHLVDFQTATGIGTFDFVSANGDRLTATFTGHANTSTQIFTIREVAEITGGTGRFAGATGSFTADRFYDTTAGTTTGTFDGMISIPAN